MAHPRASALRATALGLALVGPMAWGWGASPLAAVAGPVAGAPGSTTPTLGAAMEPSSPNQVALAEHLKRAGVLFYGAWWCPACFKQKNLFGQQAGNQLPYVECDKTETQRERCERDRIGAYPTWVKGSERLEGVQTLEKLGQWSGFQQ